MKDTGWILAVGAASRLPVRQRAFISSPGEEGAGDYVAGMYIAQRGRAYI